MAAPWTTLPVDHPASGLSPALAAELRAAGIVTVGEALDGLFGLGLIPEPPGHRARLRAMRLDDPDLGFTAEQVAAAAAEGLYTLGDLEDYKLGIR